MKKFAYLFVMAVAMIATMASCNDSETYADQKKRERSAINKYIADNGIKVISETEFNQHGCKTDTSKNEFVYLNNSSCYMQIVRKGCGEKLATGNTATVLCRYKEYNLLTDSLQSTNMVGYYVSFVDKMSVTNTSGTFTATFDTSSSLMYTLYSSSSVPSGWLVPFTYINLGRQDKPNTDEGNVSLEDKTNDIARVRIIVPHTQGHTYATSGVYPCLYDITFEKGY